MTSLLPRGQPTCLAEGDGRGGGCTGLTASRATQLGDGYGWGWGVGGSRPGAPSVCVGGGEVRGGGDGVSRHLQLMTPNLILTKLILFYISPQECKISVPILSRSRAPVQNLRSRVLTFLKCLECGNAEAQERETKNARPPLEKTTVPQCCSKFY